MLLRDIRCTIKNRNKQDPANIEAERMLHRMFV